MFIEKKSGEVVDYSEAVIKEYLLSLCYDLDMKWINIDDIISKLTMEISNKMTSDELHELLAKKCAVKISQHPDHNKLASRISIELLHKHTKNNILEVAQILYNNIDRDGKNSPLISKDVFNIITNNHEKIEAIIDYKRDYLFDYFGLKTLERAYLLKIHEYGKDKKETKTKIIERPQHALCELH